jgi:hypothetical protein
VEWGRRVEIVFCFRVFVFDSFGLYSAWLGRFVSLFGFWNVRLDLVEKARELIVAPCCVDNTNI